MNHEGHYSVLKYYYSHKTSRKCNHITTMVTPMLPLALQNYVYNSIFNYFMIDQNLLFNIIVLRIL